MKLIDLLQETRRKQILSDMDSINAYLHRAGYRLLGSPGEFAYVYQKPGSNYALKIFKANDTCYRRFLDYIQANPSPFFPKIHRQLIKLSPEFYAVRMEILQPGDSREASINAKHFVKRLVWYEAWDHDLNEMKQIYDDFDQDYMDLEHVYKGFGETIYLMVKNGLITATGQTGSGCHEDLHQKNIMWRGSVPVIIDPAY